MTPDEAALLRAVVAAPGDHLARLVYADWLDDRGDPRGAYLRAETAAPGDRGTLVPAAAGLDAVWVARASRPPIGLCSNSVQFAGAADPASAIDIAAAEQRIGGEFPPDYRVFLLDTGGGTPDPAHLDYPTPDPELDLEIGRFYGIPGHCEDRHRPLSECEANREFMEYLYQVDDVLGPNPLLVGLVPIAHTLHDLGYFLIGVADDNRGRVFHFTDYCHNVDDPRHLREYAPTFAALLSRLRPDKNP